MASITTRTVKIPAKLFRSVSVDAVRAIPGGEGEPTWYELPVSSEFPVERSFFGETWREILSHAPDAVDMTWARDGGAVLVDHATTDQVGVMGEVAIRDGQAIPRFRFGSSARAKEIERDFVEGTRKRVSIGYSVSAFQLTGSESGVDTYTATRWSLLEFSFVAVPADPTVGKKGMEGYGYRESDREPVEIEVEVEQVKEAAIVAGEHNKEGFEMAEVTTPAPAATAGADNGGERAAFILDHATRGGLSTEEIREIMSSPMTKAEAGIKILELRATKPGATQPAAEAMRASAQADAAVPLKDRQRYNFARAVWGMACEKNPQLGTAKFDGVERDVHKELEKNLPDGFRGRGGFFSPASLSGYGTRTVSTATTAGNLAELVQDQFGGLISGLYPGSLIDKLGVTKFDGLSGGPVTFPRESTLGASTWAGEAPAAAISDANETVDQVVLYPKTLMATTSFTAQLAAQASVDIGNFMDRKLNKRHGVALDIALLHGTGLSNQPLGAYLTPGALTQAMSSAVPTHALLMGMIAKILNANVDGSNWAWVMNPLMAGKLATVPLTSATNGMYLIDKLVGGTMLGLPVHTSTNASGVMSGLASTGSTEQAIIAAAWDQAYVGRWGVREILVNPYSLDTLGEIRVTSREIVDLAWAHPEAVCVSTAATLA
jgi:HK97 family phage major capsid protein